MAAPKLKRYIVTGEVTISCSVIVYAEDEAGAVEAADMAPMMDLCHQCAGGRDVAEWSTSGELDGTPTINEVEEDVRHKTSKE